MTTKKEILKIAGYVPKIGRPSVGDLELPAITVPDSLKAALGKKASALGLSVPDARREAYRKFVE